MFWTAQSHNPHYKTPPLDHIIHQVQSSTHLQKLRVSTIPLQRQFPTTPKFPKRSLPFQFSNQNLARISCLFYSDQASQAAGCWINCSNSIRLRTQTAVLPFFAILSLIFLLHYVYIALPATYLFASFICGSLQPMTVIQTVHKASNDCKPKN